MSFGVLPEAAHYECIPDGGFVIRRDRFKGAHWDGEVLEIDLGAIRRRVVPLTRPVSAYEAA